MDILSALERLLVIQRQTQVVDPTPLAVKAAYLTSPPRGQALPDTPCWLNGYALNRIAWQPSRFEYYTVHAQLFVDDADLDRAARGATALLGQFIADLAADYQLGGNAVSTDLRGGDPTLAMLEWAGRAYVGLDLFVDVELWNDPP